MQKNSRVAGRALGLLYSYNCDANRRSHREIEFPVPVSDWLMHVFGEVSLSIAYCQTVMIVKVHRQHRLQSVLIPRVLVQQYFGGACKAYKRRCRWRTD